MPCPVAQVANALKIASGSGAASSVGGGGRSVSVVMAPSMVPCVGDCLGRRRPDGRSPFRRDLWEKPSCLFYRRLIVMKAVAFTATVGPLAFGGRQRGQPAVVPPGRDRRAHPAHRVRPGRRSVPEVSIAPRPAPGSGGD